MFIILSIVSLILHPVSAEKNIYIMGIDEDYLPWEAFDNSSAYGINVEIVKIISKKMNINVSYKKLPMKRILLSLENGEIDFCGGLAKKSDREIYAQYIEPPYIPSTKAFFSWKGSNVKISNYNDLYNYKIGLRLGNKQFEPFDSDDKITKIEKSTDDQLFKLLELQRIDALVGSMIQIQYYTKVHGLDDKIIIQNYKIDKGRSGYFVISKKSSLLPRAVEFESILKKLLENGEIDRIINSNIKK